MDVDVGGFLVAWFVQRAPIDVGIDVAEAVFVLMSVIGQHYISDRNKSGFYFWGVGNLVAIGMFAFVGRWLTACLYVYFLWKCCTGLVKWSRLQRQEQNLDHHPSAAVTAPAPMPLPEAIRRLAA